MRKNVLSKFRNRKTNIFLVFLVLSLLFSILTKLSKNYTTTIRFDADLRELPIDKVIINDSTHYFDVTLKTYGFKILRYYLTKPKLNLDAPEIIDTEEAYVWNRENHYANLVSQFEQNVSVESINPNSIRFEYDQNGYNGGFVNKGSYILKYDGLNIVEVTK